MAKIGRNDPCSCGSGKKYKSCHMAQDEARDRQRSQLSTVSAWLGYHGDAALGAGLAAAEATGRRADAFAAFATNAAPDDPIALGFAACDFPLDDNADVGVSHATRAAPAADTRPEDVEDRALVFKAFAESHLSIHEVLECKRGKGVRLRDVFTGADDFVWDEQLGDSLEPLEYVLGRRLGFAERPLLALGWEKLAFRGRKRLVAAQRAAFEAAQDHEDPVVRRAQLKALAPSLAAAVRALNAPVA